jgi:tellurite resistance protein TerC
MGLRQLYFLLGGLLDRLKYLSYGLAIVLGFIGVKLILEALAGNNLSFINNGEPIKWAPHVPIWFSLLFIGITLAVTTVISLRTTADDDTDSSGPAPKPAVAGPRPKGAASKRPATKRHPTKKR